MILPAMASEGFIDLHSHVLNGVDDGPATLEESLEVIQGMVSLGFETVYATPHQRVDLYTPALEVVREACEDLRGVLQSKGTPVALYHGAENCWDPLLFERSQAGEIPPYEGTQSFLVEMPGPFLPAGVARQLFEWRRAGFLPVVAHVERYLGTPQLLERAHEISGAGVVSCNLESLGGGLGRKVAKTARAMVLEGAARVLCTDIHGEAWLKPTSKGLRWVRRHLPPEAVKRLLVTNPRRILAGELPEE
jgi:protein-tyrosine phosphatase